MIQPGTGRRATRAVLPLALALLALPASAQEPASQEREHVVRRGDTLWDLAGQYLANPFLWPMIFEANRSVVENPHWIYPGERLRIPGVPAEAAAEPLGEPVAEAAAAAPVAAPVGGAEPARPGAAVMLELRRPVIPVAEYLSTPWLDPGAGSRVVGRVIGLADAPGTATDKIPPALHPHYRVYIGELRSQGAQVGDSLLLVRLGREVSGHGQVIQPLAVVRVDAVAEGVLTGQLTVQFEGAAVGDVLIPLDARPEIPLGRPQQVSGGAEGQLIDFLVAQQIYGTGDHGFVSMAGETLRIGDELALYAPGAGTGTIAVPATEVARARVVRVAERAATVRLIGVFDTSVRAGLPVRLIARMP